MAVGTIIHKAVIRRFVFHQYFVGDNESNICTAPTARINQEDKFEISLENNRKTTFFINLSHTIDNFWNLYIRKIVDYIAVFQT